VWLEIVSVGCKVSAPGRLTVMFVVRALPEPSVATTVSTFAPGASVTLRLQFAVELPEDEPPVATEPLTVTRAIPLPPAPLSLAVPASVMPDVLTV
jgi:hypothetical protein